MNTIHENAMQRARELVHEAMGVIMRSFSPEDTPSWRAEIAIRHIVYVLEQQAELSNLPADLRIALFEVACGEEPVQPEYVRQCYDMDDGLNPPEASQQLSDPVNSRQQPGDVTP